MKPMLACSTMPSLDDIKFPVLASYKLDGIRCLIVNGIAVSRALKPIPNKFIQQELSLLPNINGCDGELMLRTGDFNKVQSAVMSETGTPDFVYRVFDNYLSLFPFKNRSDGLNFLTKVNNNKRIEIIEQYFITNKEDLQELYNKSIELGYEGLIVRDPTAPYKQGRSTLKQGWMLKMKPVEDAEAIIVSCNELMRNANDAELDNLGYQMRSRQQDGMYGGNTLGSFTCDFNGVQLNIGSGFTAEQRDELWSKRESLIGSKVTFKYQELSSYGVPRFPVFKGIRHAQDLD